MTGRPVNILVLPLLLIFLLAFLLPSFARTFTLASYNVENLFDATRDGTEYPDYIPGGPTGWTAEMAALKTDHMARVIKALQADIVCLQEIESRRALDDLLARLKETGAAYRFSALADQRPTTVKCALISKFPIAGRSEIDPGRPNLRSILKVALQVDQARLVVFVNHWRSKQGPESQRRQSARALEKALQKLPPDTDFVLAGDFNASYDAHLTLPDNPRLNDTQGKTGINHVLGTIHQGKLLTEQQVRQAAPPDGLYNLWLELPPYRRWSHNFYGQKNSLDSLIIPPALFDPKGISYCDNSFEKFDPDFLFRQQAIFRWQRAQGGRGRHLGQGYSDHLPILARFTTAPFEPAESAAPNSDPAKAPASWPAPSEQPIAALYTTPPGRVNIRLKDCLVVYRQRHNAVVKQPGNRAIFIYKAARKLAAGEICDLTVRRLKDFHGLREITQIADLAKSSRTAPAASGWISVSGRDLSAPRLQNEIVAEVSGRFSDGDLHYPPDHRIRLYFKDKSLRPKNNARIRLTGVRIGFHDSPELVITSPDQIDAAAGPP